MHFPLKKSQKKGIIQLLAHNFSIPVSHSPKHGVFIIVCGYTTLIFIGVC